MEEINSREYCRDQTRLFPEKSTAITYIRRTSKAYILSACLSHSVSSRLD